MPLIATAPGVGCGQERGGLEAFIRPALSIQRDKVTAADSLEMTF